MTSRNCLTNIFLTLGVILMGVGLAGGQVINATAGLVKKVSGEVLVHCHERQPNNSELQVGEIIHNEDIVTTTKSASMVLALNPDSYLLMSSETTIHVKETAFGGMHFDVVAGEIIVRVATLKNGTSLLLHPPLGPIEIRKKGLYRVFVKDGGETQVNVVSGELSYIGHNKRAARLKKNGQVDFVKANR